MGVAECQTALHGHGEEDDVEARPKKVMAKAKASHRAGRPRAQAQQRAVAGVGREHGGLRSVPSRSVTPAR